MHGGVLRRGKARVLAAELLYGPGCRVALLKWGRGARRLLHVAHDCLDGWHVELDGRRALLGHADPKHVAVALRRAGSGMSGAGVAWREAAWYPLRLRTKCARVRSVLSRFLSR